MYFAIDDERVMAISQILYVQYHILGYIWSVILRKNLWSHRFSQNTNKKFALYSASKNPDNFCSYFGRNDDFISSFWNQLTFILGLKARGQAKYGSWRASSCQKQWRITSIILQGYQFWCIMIHEHVFIVVAWSKGLNVLDRQQIIPYFRCS